MRVLLVAPPVFEKSRPHYALSLLKAVLVERGHACTVWYANLEFTRAFPAWAMSAIDTALPELLLGDLLFAEALHGQAPDAQARADLLARHDLGDGEMGAAVRRFLGDEFPELSAQAAAFYRKAAQRPDVLEADLVGIAAMFGIASPLALARAITSQPSAPPVVIGGPHTQAEMGLGIAEAFPWLDYVARGEGENLLTALLSHLERGTPTLDRIPGLIWRDESGLHVNGEAGVPRTLDSLPEPRHDDWFEQLQPGDLWNRAHRMLPFETSRGCWYGAKTHCTFCGLNGDDMEFRRMSPDRALAAYGHLIELARERDITLMFGTDTILDHRYFETVLPRLAELDPPCPMFYETKANLKEDQVALLAAAGITWIQPGIESLSTPVLRLMRKGVAAWQNVRLLRFCAQYEVGVVWNLLWGFAGEQPEDYLAMARLIPALAHLFPPSDPHVIRVRVDRFSPLHTAPEDHGLRLLGPLPGYAVALGVQPEAAARIAYYFDHAYVDEPPDEAYVRPVDEAVVAWHRQMGQVAFTSVMTEEGLCLFDSREIATCEEAVLTGPELELYQRAQDGPVLRNLRAETDLPEREFDRIVERFVANAWAVELDGRLLTLAVPMDRSIPPDTPRERLGAVAQSLASARISFATGPVGSPAEAHVPA